jgi:hypothetical protein
MKAATLGLIIVSCLTFSCRHKVTASDPARFERVDRHGYSYQRFDDGAVAIAAATPADLRLAMNEIGCGERYVCTVEANGTLYQVTQKIK